ncbi:MAG: hypothetical protein U1G07_25575 [Verrucomicrobiota bacterium]
MTRPDGRPASIGSSGLENGQFFLSHGGFIPGYAPSGEKFERPATGLPPADLVLPEIPA